MSSPDWDAICVAPVGMINGLLAQSPLKIAPIDVKLPDFAAQILLDSPKIVAGGSGTLVHLEFTASSMGPTAGMPGLADARYSLTLQCDLNLVDRQDAAYGAAAVLKLDPRRADSVDGKVVVVNSTIGQVLPGLKGAVIDETVAASLGENLDALSPVLAELAPSAGDGGWLRLVNSACTYQETQADGAVVAVMIATDGRDTPELPLQVSEKLIAHAPALAVSLGLFSGHLLGPALARALAVDPAEIDSRSDGSARITSRIDVPDQIFSAAGLHPWLDTAVAAPQAGKIVLDLAGACDLQDDISLSFKASMILLPVVGDDGRLSFVQQGDMGFSPDIDMPWYDEAAASLSGVIDGPDFKGRINNSAAEVAHAIGAELVGISNLTALSEIVRWGGARPMVPTGCLLDDVFILTFNT